jgi:antitoxin (DNA-binding transcriptional repressor) of toxin-antitoxin stability system
MTVAAGRAQGAPTVARRDAGVMTPVGTTRRGSCFDPLAALAVLANNLVMIKANILDAKTNLSDYVDRATQGERVIICRHNQPVAELRAVDVARTSPRPIGPLPDRPTFDVPETFFEPIAEEELVLWEGGGPAEPSARYRSPHRSGAVTVPETATGPRPRRRRTR